MKLVFKLSKQNSKLSKAEVLNLFPNSDFTLLDNYLIIDIKYNNSQIQRLAYTQSVYKLLFFSTIYSIEKAIITTTFLLLVGWVNTVPEYQEL